MIIGGGAAGLYLASFHPRCVILERGDECGRKLLLTGGGRCNYTHRGSARELIPHYHGSLPFVRKVLYSHTNTDIISHMKELGIQPEAWGPFAEGKHGIFTHPVLTAIGEKYGKSAAQVALRWNVQRDVVVIPKSTHRDRMEQNIDIWDFSLSDEDMAEIAKLDIGHSEIVDHSDPAFIRMISTLKVVGKVETTIANEN